MAEGTCNTASCLFSLFLRWVGGKGRMRRRDGVGWCEGSFGVGVLHICVFIHNTPRFHSQMNPTRAPATLVCAGSFISSPITGPLFPLWFWMGFKSLIITTVTSEWRACESGDQLGVSFSYSSPHVWHHGAVMFFIHTPTDNATLRSWFCRGRPRCHWLANVCLIGVCGQVVQVVCCLWETDITL